MPSSMFPLVLYYYITMITCVGLLLPCAPLGVLNPNSARSLARSQLRPPPSLSPSFPFTASIRSPAEKERRKAVAVAVASPPPKYPWTTKASSASTAASVKEKEDLQPEDRKKVKRGAATRGDVSNGYTVEGRSASGRPHDISQFCFIMVRFRDRAVRTPLK